MWLNAIDHIQVTSSPEAEDAMLFFYGKVLGLTEIPKPETIKANKGAWYVLGNIQIHVSTEQNPNNAASRRHICYLVSDLQAFQKHLRSHSVEIIADKQPIPGRDRFFLRDPAGNRIEIATRTVSLDKNSQPEKMIFDQEEFNLRCEWGAKGVSELAPISDVVVIVDVLSFSTSTEIATNNGAIIYPYQWRDESALEYAQSVQAELSKGRLFKDGYSLSPASLTKIPAGTKLVIPSPNGSSLTLLTGKTPTIAGCLRNSEAVAKFAQKYGSRIAVIPAGEKWEDNTLRPAFEDLIGAGAILSYLNGSLSPEAETAVVAFHAFKHDLLTYLKQCSSGKELIAKGFELDVELAAAFNVSDCVPLFTENAYINQQLSIKSGEV